MANLWEKVKHTLEQGAKSISETTTSTAKSVAKSATQVTSTVVETGKDIALAIGDKSQEVTTVGKLKIRHYNISKEISNKFREMGSLAFEVISQENKDIYDDEDVQRIIEEIKKLESDIHKVEVEIEEAKLKQSAKAEQKDNAEQSEQETLETISDDDSDKTS